MKIIFFGTPLFAAEILAYLLDHGVEVIGIVTKPDVAKGRSSALRPPAVKEVAQNKAPSIPIYQPERASSAEFINELAALKADLFVVVAYGQLLKQNLLDLPRLGCINVHASLLPKYRGAAPIQRCLIEGETETGITIMQMVLALDAGDMLCKISMPIPENMNYGELERALCQLSKKPLLETIMNISSGSIRPIPQDPAQVTFAPKIELENTKILWNLPAKTIHNLIRGVFPQPGAWCHLQVKGQTRRLKVCSAKVADIELASESPPGRVLSFGKNLIVACGEGALELLELQLEGKKAISAAEFMRGYSKDQLNFLVS